MKILINRSDAIGDLILTMPVLKTLKTEFPNCEIGLIISPRTTELVTLFSDMIDNSWVVDKKDSFVSKLKLTKSIIEEFNPTHYFYIGGDTTANLAAFLGGVSFRGGLMSKAQTFLTLNKGVRQKRSKAMMHESDYNLELLKPLKESIKANKEISVGFENSDSDFFDFQNEIEKAGLNPQDKLVFVHPGMTGHTLNWPIEYYSEFIIRLAKERADLNFIISHTPSDAKYIEELKNSLSEKQKLPLYFFDGSKRGLVHYAKILSRANLFLGPSTGTTHIANLVGIPQIGIYSPILVQSAKRWGPLRRDNRVQIMDPVIECHELEQSAGDHRAHSKWMKSIDVDKVVSHAQKFLSKGEENANASRE